jgi:hypothetical protein
VRAPARVNRYSSNIKKQAKPLTTNEKRFSNRYSFRHFHACPPQEGPYRGSAHYAVFSVRRQFAVGPSRATVLSSLVTCHSPLYFESPQTRIQKFGKLMKIKEKRFSNRNKKTYSGMGLPAAGGQLMPRCTNHPSQITSHRSPITTPRSNHHFYLRRRTILQAVENQFDARGDAELVENAKEIIADVFLLARGWTARTVAISCYFLTACLGLLGWFGMVGGMRRSLILGVGIFAGLVLSAWRLGTARLGAMKHSRYRAEL